MDDQERKVIQLNIQAFNPNKGSGNAAGTVKAIGQTASKMAKRYPNTDVGQIKSRNTDGTYEVQQAVGIGVYKVHSSVGVIGSKWSNFVAGTMVRLFYYKANPNRPWIWYIIGYKPVQAAPDPLEPIIAAAAGQWLQVGGFWWAPFAPIEQINPLYQESTAVTIHLPEDVAIDYNATDHKVRVIITDAPIGFHTDTVSAVVDGVPKTTGFTSGSIGTDPPTYFIDLNSILTEPSEIVLDFTYSTAGELVAGGNDANEGPISLRGVVLFPHNGEQFGATLNQTYSISGVEYVPQSTAYSTQAPYESGFAIPLLYTPAIFNSQDQLNTSISFFVDNPDFPYIKYLVKDDSLYAIIMFPSVFGIRYDVTLDASEYTENFLIGEYTNDTEFTYFPTGPEHTLDFNLYAPAIGRDWSSYECQIVQRFDDGFIIPFTQAGDVVTIDPTGLSETEATRLRFGVYFNWNDPYKFALSGAHAVGSLVSVTTPLGEDLGATFEYVYGRWVVTLTQDLTGYNGSEITVVYEGLTSENRGWEWDESGDNVVFELPDVPVPDSAHLDLDNYSFAGIFPDGWPTKIIFYSDADDPSYANGKFFSVAVQIPGDGTIEDGVTYLIYYIYKRISSQLFNFASSIIREFNITSPAGITNLPVPLTGDATPPSKFDSLIDWTSSENWTSGWDLIRYGYLFFDPNYNAYTVVSPAGLSYRSRTPGSANYITTPWPTEPKSQDPYWTGGWSYPSNPSWGSGGIAPDAIENLLRRTAPYLGVSVMGRYALQGSWGPISTNITFEHVPRDWGGGTGGNAADIAFPLRGFKRNKRTNVWELIKELNPLDLVKDNAGNNPVYMPGAGIFHREGRGGISYGHGIIRGNVRNTWWPMTKDCKSWIVGAGWCEAEWMTTPPGRNFVTDPDEYSSFPFGHADAGFTLNAIDPVTLEITSQLTIKADPEYIEGIFEDDEAYAFYAREEIAHSGAAFGATTFDLYETWLASANYGYYPGYTGLRFFYYVMNALDDENGRIPNLRYPGIPSLADGAPRYAASYNNTKIGVGAEDNFQSQDISLGSDGDLYFCLSIPYWVRIDDEQLLRRGETVTGTWVDPNVPFDCTPYIAGSVYNPINGQVHYYLGNNRSKYITGWMGGPIITNITGPGAVTFSAYGPTAILALPWAGYFSPFIDLINHVGFYLPILEDLANPTHNTDLNDEDYISGYPGLANTCTYLEVPWRQDIPNQTWTTPVISHDKYEPGITYTAHTLGSGASLPPWSGVIVFAITGNNYRRYEPNARTFLFRIECKNGILTEKWRKEISYTEQVGPSFSSSNYGTPHPGTRTDNTMFLKTYFTRQVGRVIFILRRKPVVYASKVVAYILDNTVSPAVLLHEIDVPPGAGTPNPPDTLDMYEGIDKTGNEWMAVGGFIMQVPGHGTQYSEVLIRMKESLTDAPTVFYRNMDGDPSADISPSGKNLRGIAYASDTYVWMTNRADIYKRSV